MANWHNGPQTRPATLFVFALASLLACAGIVSTPARASIIAPASLTLGATFQLVFVTSASTTAASSAMADYDSFVNGLADNAGLGTYNGAAVIWTVLGSTETVSAVSREPITSTAPIYTLDGNQVANNAAGLWSSNLLNPIDINEYGSYQYSLVWTGSHADGTSDVHIALGDTLSIIGDDLNTNHFWIFGSAASTQFNENLYAISSILTVSESTAPIPEPAMAAVLGMGLASLAVLRRRTTVRNPSTRAALI